MYISLYTYISIYISILHIYISHATYIQITYRFSYYMLPMHISYYILHISPGVVARGAVVCGVVAGGVAMYNKHIHTHTHIHI